MAIPLLVLTGIAPSAVKQLEEAGFEAYLARDHGGRAAAIASFTQARAVLTSGSLGLTGDEISALPHLEIILAIGAGFEGIDLEAANARSIVVTNGSGANSRAVADHAMTLLLAIAGALLPSNANVMSGRWQTLASPPEPAKEGETSAFPYQRVGVSGKKLGILGLGTIGREIAHRAADGFDMEVAYHNRNPVEGVPYAWESSAVALAEWADFLIVAAPGGKETYHLVDAELLSALGPEGYLVNIGRGTVVDTEALLDALDARRIAGAALDVVEGEPEIPPRLLTTEGLLLTPHMAGGTPESRVAMFDLATSNLVAWFEGKPVRNRVNG